MLLNGSLRRRSRRWRTGTGRRRAWWAAAASPRYYLVWRLLWLLLKTAITHYSQAPISTNVKLPKCGLVCGEKVTVTVKVLLSAIIILS